jgi:hypothetical protein
MQERAGNTLELIGTGNYLLNRTQQLRKWIDKWAYMKFRFSAQQKKQSPD